MANPTTEEVLVWPDRDPDDLSDFAIGGWKKHFDGGMGTGDTLLEIMAAFSDQPELAVTGPNITGTGDKASVYLAGGVEGTWSVVTIRGRSVMGRTMDRSARIYTRPR